MSSLILSITSYSPYILIPLLGYFSLFDNIFSGHSSMMTFLLIARLIVSFPPSSSFIFSDLNLVHIVWNSNIWIYIPKRSSVIFFSRASSFFHITSHSLILCRIHILILPIQFADILLGKSNKLKKDPLFFIRFTLHYLRFISCDFQYHFMQYFYCSEALSYSCWYLCTFHI